MVRASSRATLPELRDLRRSIHRTIKKVTDDIEGRFHFNTAIAAIMELFNALSAAAQTEPRADAAAAIIKEGLETLIILLAPFVPHAANELWEQTGHRETLDQVPWPTYSKEALEEEKLLIVVQVNGKVRGKITVPADGTQERIQTEALGDAEGDWFSRWQKGSARGLCAPSIGEYCRGGINSALFKNMQTGFLDLGLGQLHHWLRLSICR